MYWPQRQGFYGEIEVTVEDIIKQDDYVLRIFAVKVSDSKTQTTLQGNKKSCSRCIIPRSKAGISTDRQCNVV